MFKDSYNPSDMKIAYFAGTMQPGQDGVTRVLYNLIKELNKRGIRNIFFSPIIPAEEERTTKMYKVPAMTFPLYKDYKLAIPGSNSFINRLKKFNPDIIHFNSPCTLGYAAAKTGSKLGIPTVATYHTHFASYAKYYKVRALESYSWNYFRILYNKCAKVYVPSRPILKELNLHGIKNLTFLPHGVDSQIFNPKFRSMEWRRNLGIENETVLLYSGRLVWEKDLRVLADAYKIISQSRNDIVFVLAGSGPVRRELQKMMPGALFLGYQEGLGLSTAYASSDILVFPSTTETFGNVTLEAMASGIPAICARGGGAYDLIEDEVTGLIAEPGNAVDFADKILKLSDDITLRNSMSTNAYQFAKGQSWSNIFDRLFESYLEVVEEYRFAVQLK